MCNAVTSSAYQIRAVIRDCKERNGYTLMAHDNGQIGQYDIAVKSKEGVVDLQGRKHSSLDDAIAGVSFIGCWGWNPRIRNGRIPKANIQERQN